MVAVHTRPAPSSKMSASKLASLSAWIALALPCEGRLRQCEHPRSGGCGRTRLLARLLGHEKQLDEDGRLKRAA